MGGYGREVGMDGGGDLLGQLQGRVMVEWVALGCLPGSPSMALHAAIGFGNVGWMIPRSAQASLLRKSLLTWRVI